MQPRSVERELYARPLIELTPNATVLIYRASHLNIPPPSGRVLGEILFPESSERIVVFGILFAEGWAHLCG